MEKVLALLKSANCESPTANYRNGKKPSVETLSPTSPLNRSTHGLIVVPGGSVETSSAGSSASTSDESSDHELDVDNQDYDCGTFILTGFHVNEFDTVHQFFRSLVLSPDDGCIFFGTDEYSTEAGFRNLLAASTVCLVRRPFGCQLLGFICVTDTKFSRSSLRCHADIILGLSKEALLMDDGIFIAVMDQVYNIATQLDFTSVIYETFSTNYKLRPQLDALGFEQLAEVPKSAQPPGQGWTSSVVYQKYIPQNVNKPAYSYLADEHYVERNLGTQIVNRRLPYLPLTLTTKSGLGFILDYMKCGDMQVVADLIRTAALNGHGYTTDDLEELDESDACLQDPSYTYLGLYDPTSATPTVPFGALVFCPHNWTRSVVPCVADVWIVISPAYEGKGIGSVLSTLWSAIPGDLGYEGLLIDIFANNPGMLKIMQKLKYLFVGKVPKCGDVVGAGWTDVCLFFTPTTSAAQENLL